MALTDFRIREAEQKMREAATRLDYEEAIVLRDKIKAMRAEVPVEAPRPKVVNFRTKEEFIPEDVPEIEEAPTVVELAVQADVVEMLEKITEDAKAGKIQAFSMAYSVEPVGSATDVSYAYSDGVLDQVSLFVGGLHTLANDLLAVEQDMYEIEIVGDGE